MGRSSVLLRQALTSTGPVPLPQSLECISTGNPRLVESPGLKCTKSSKETPGEEFRTNKEHFHPPFLTFPATFNDLGQYLPEGPPRLPSFPPSKEGLNWGGKS